MQNITVEIKKKSIGISSNLVAIGKGGMNPGVYDPNEIKADVFNMDNMVDGEEKHYVTDEQIETWDAKQDALTAGDNITIDENNVISATDTTYTAGEGISIDENNVISNTQTSAEWGNIQGDIEDQEDLQQALGNKQDVLTAGENIDITDNVISATDTTYQSCDFDINDLSDSCSCRQTWNNKQNALTAGDNIDITGDVISATDTTYESCDFDIKDLADSCSCRQTWDAKQNALTAGDNIDITGDTISATDTIPNNATLTIQKNSCTLDTFTADASEDKTINITVPVTAADVNALPDTTKYGASVEMSINSSTYVVTLTLKDQDGNTLGSAQTIDLPLESVVVSGSYDADTKEVVLVLEGGSEIRFSVADLVSGLQTEITVDNKLDADLVDDSTSTNKFVTATDKCTWNAKADICDIPTDNCQLANGCGYLQSAALNCYAKCCDIPTDNCQLGNGCGYTTCTGTLVPSDIQNLAQCCDIPTDNCQLANSCGYTTCTGTLVQSDIQNLAQCCDIPTDNCQLANSCGYTTCTGTLVASDIQNLAQCCDVPTDNCQLANSCGYTTCTGTLVQSDIQNLAQCCDIPTDNCQLANGCGYITCSDLPDLSGYQLKCNMVCNLTNADNDHYPTAKAVSDAMACAGVGDMLKSVYDPCGCEADAFNACNMYNMPHIPTDNCELSNSCGYTTCTGTLVQSDLDCYAQCCDIPSACDFDINDLGDACSCKDTWNCKQDALTAGNNITINGTTISGDFNYAEPTTAAACTTKCVCIPEITQLCAGQTIIVKPTITATNCATNIKLNNFEAYPVRYNNGALTSTTDGYVRGASQLTQFLFDGSYWHVVGKSYDTNTTYTMNYSVDGGKYTAGVGKYAISRYSLVLQKQDGTWETVKETSTNYSIATTKIVNTNGFVLGKIRYYNTTTVVANGALIAENTLYNKAASVDMRYSTNCGGTTDWAVGDFIYLVGTIGVDGLFYLDTTKRWSNTLPNTNDGKVYIRLGIALAAAGYTMSLLDDRPIFYYDNGIKIYQQADNKQDIISDLDTIRSGASAGSTAVQPGDLCSYAQCCDIPTDNCQLANSCGYTTCTGTLVSSDLNPYAKTCTLCTVATSGKYCDLTGTPSLCTVATSGKYCDLTGTPTIPTDNCQLANSCGYTTCTGTLVASDLTPYAKTCTLCTVATSGKYCDLTGTPSLCTVATSGKYCDLTGTPTIPTDNCQLANSCGYTTCTGTLVASDLNPYAKTCTLCTVATSGKYCDLTGTPTIPTNNNQLTNGCGYTTCTGTLTPSSLVTINGCCLVGSGDICIQGGGGGDELMTQEEYTCLPDTKLTDGVIRWIYEDDGE